MVEVPDPAWIEARLVAARPRAVAALLRYFRDLDLAEEAFQLPSIDRAETEPWMARCVAPRAAHRTSMGGRRKTTALAGSRQESDVRLESDGVAAS